MHSQTNLKGSCAENACHDCNMILLKWSQEYTFLPDFKEMEYGTGRDKRGNSLTDGDGDQSPEFLINGA